MFKEDKCHFCNKLAVSEKRIVVDIEANHETDEEGHELWYSHPVYETVGICEEHVSEEIEGDIREGEE
jgi:hypothetical protein